MSGNEEQKKINIAICQSGGPTSAINATLAGIFEAAAERSEIGRIYGAMNGIEGMIGEVLVPLDSIITSKHDLELLKRTPSTVLGSSGYKLKKYDQSDSKTETEYMNIAETFKEYGIGAFFLIGGGDTMDTAANLHRYVSAVGMDVKIIGVPKSVDNSLSGTDHSPGFGSAAKYTAAAMQEIIRDSRVYSSQSVTIAETMGKSTGWLAASSCVLRANGESAPHLIYVPEAFPEGLDPAKLISDTEQMMKRYRAVMIAVSEGVFLKGEKRSDTGIAKKLEGICSEKFPCKVRSVELSVMQRCSSHIASRTDIDEAVLIGREAVGCALSGKSGKMMSFSRISNEPYRVEITAVGAECAGGEKYLPEKWITEDGCGITNDALYYFLPLIKGEIATEYRNGIPVHFRLNR